MPVINTSDQNIGELLKENKKVIIKFHAEWCSLCRAFRPQFETLSEDERFVNVVFVDIDAEQNAEIRQLAGVTNLPFFTAFKDGKLIECNSTTKVEVVTSMLERIL